MDLASAYYYLQENGVSPLDLYIYYLIISSEEALDLSPEEITNMVTDIKNRYSIDTELHSIEYLTSAVLYGAEEEEIWDEL